MKKAQMFFNVYSCNKRSTLKQSLWISSALLLISNSTLATPHILPSSHNAIEWSISTIQDKPIKGTVRDATTNTYPPYELHLL